MTATGWIPVESRTPEQLALTYEFNEFTQTFGDVGSSVDTPDRVIFEELEQKHLGEVLPRVWQVTGSCVGAGAAVAYSKAALGDAVFRGDAEEVSVPFPYATYGVGRQIAGMRGRGEGSFGAAQAKAVSPEHFGMLHGNDERVPQPQIVAGNWLRWTKSQELMWSHPTAWPVSLSNLKPTAMAFGMHTVTRVTDTDQWVQLLAQGYGVTLASMFGTRPSVEGDVLIGRWNGSWSHQMSSSGYWKHSRHGRLFKIDNQWGPNAHGDCPTLKPLGCTGSFWMTEKDAERVVRTGEVFGHSATGGFPSHEGLWGDLW